MGDYDFNIFQQIYCLSMMTGFVSKQTGSEQFLQDKLKECLDEALPELPGSWSISWGPRVYQELNPEEEDKSDESDKRGPDNVWFAAVDDTQKVCVVAIAGTASNSDADIYQDITVSKVVDFDAWVELWSLYGIPEPYQSAPTQETASTLPFCAKGICVGVWNVMNNSSTRYGEVIRIDQYLRSLDPSYTIVVTGHSLGGALAPLVALGLAKSGLVDSNNLKVLPSAGVSPGNEKFAADYAATFLKDPESATDYQVYNTDYYNEFDIVPQAWSVDPEDDRNLDIIQDKIIHTDNTILAIEVSIIVGNAKLASHNSQIRYTPLPGQRFTGPTPQDPIHDKDELRNVLGNEHVCAYWDELGITDFMNKFDEKFSKRIGVHDTSQARE
ncbi:hypothetical protein F5X99DRAFT_402064 [Biscogniauxia marginata]|nr:hypothetical protein F5X99DRAFT_402064 [Biscogniauxia marginata]